MSGHRSRAAPPRPLDARRLDELAVRYVGRYATTRAKLTRYLERKLRERGWAGDEPPAPDRVVERCVAAGYVDDAAFAAARAGALAGRGYGNQRIGAALHVAGIAREVAQDLRLDDEAALAAALRFAQRRRLGQFGAPPANPKARQRQVAAMARAGHGFDVIQRVLKQDGDEGD